MTKEMDIPAEQTDEGQMAIRQNINQQNNAVFTEGKSNQQQRKRDEYGGKNIWRKQR
jgi:hypothetical protein